MVSEEQRSFVKTLVDNQDFTKPHIEVFRDYSFQYGRKDPIYNFVEFNRNDVMRWGVGDYECYMAMEENKAVKSWWEKNRL